MIRRTVKHFLFFLYTPPEGTSFKGNGDSRGYGWVLLLFVLGWCFFGIRDRAAALEVRIEPPPVQGAIRYARWSPLDVTVRKSSSRPRFSGTLRVRGAGGYRSDKEVFIASGKRSDTIRVPVFCSSSLPVYRVTVRGEDGDVRARAQRRFRTVFGSEEAVVGVSSVFSDRLIDELRDRLSSTTNGSFQLISARTEDLRQMGRWPGVFDRLYLPESAGLSVPVFTDLAEAGPVPYGADKLPSIRLVDPGAYDVFSPPEISDRRRSWIGRSLLLVGFILLVGVLFCFRKPSSSLNWVLLVALPCFLSVFIFLRMPKRPSVISQVVSVQVSDERYETNVTDQLISLFPHARTDGNEDEERRERSDGADQSAGRTVRYPISEVRRTIPLFYRESAISSRFPRLRGSAGEHEFFWPDFPENGYFVLQRFDRRPYSDAAVSVRGPVQEERITVKNTSGHRIRNAWIRVEGRFYPLGRIPSGASRTVNLENPSVEVRSREQFRSVLDVNRMRGGQTMNRWMEYILNQYGRDRPVVMGKKTGEVDGDRDLPDRHDRTIYSELLLHRFQLRNGKQSE